MLRLSGLTACLLLCLHSPLLLANAQDPLIESPERTHYIEQLKQQHATDDERTALLSQINSLLAEHAFLMGYQLGQRHPQDYRYSLTPTPPGNLTFREERRDAANQINVRHRVLPIYGIDSFFNVECYRQQPYCEIFHPTLSAPLVRIVRQPDAAQALSKALSYLVRDLQSN